MTFSSSTAISAWAAHVQPGSPSPRSPHRSSPTTAAIRDFKADLTTVGYTSVFLPLPNTPISAHLKNIPSPTCQPRRFTRFRSLSVLRSRGRSKYVGLDSPTRIKTKATAASAAIVKHKKTKYVMRPPPLINELALMQFTDGGRTDSHVKRIMEAQANATGTSGLADVHRDGRGGIWLDQDEEWEYTHLLQDGDNTLPRPTGDLQWVTFGNCMSPGDEWRRGSVSTRDSDMDPKYLVQPIDQFDGDDVGPFIANKPSMSILSLPSRPCRAAKHLQKPDFLVDVAFTSGASVGMQKPTGKARRRPAPLKLSPPSPAFKRPSNSPIDPDKVRQDFIEASFEPLPVSVSVMPTLATAVPVRVRATNMSKLTVHNGVTRLAMKKPSMLNMMALFRTGKKENAMS